MSELLSDLAKIVASIDHEYWTADFAHAFIRTHHATIKHLAERQAAKEGVLTDEIVCRADVAQREFFESTHFTGDSEKLTHEAMRAALASVWPTVGVDAQDAKRYQELMSSNNLKHPDQLIDCVRYATADNPDWSDRNKWDMGIDWAIAAAEGEKK